MQTIGFEPIAIENPLSPARRSGERSTRVDALPLSYVREYMQAAGFEPASLRWRVGNRLSTARFRAKDDQRRVSALPLSYACMRLGDRDCTCDFEVPNFALYC